MSDKILKTDSLSERQLLRVAMEDFVVNAWKTFASDRKMDAKSAIEFLIWEYTNPKIENQMLESETGKKKYRILYSNASGANQRSVWLTTAIYMSVKEYAKNFPASTNRIVYSALIHGLKKHKYINIE